MVQKLAVGQGIDAQIPQDVFVKQCAGGGRLTVRRRRVVRRGGREERGVYTRPSGQAGLGGEHTSGRKISNAPLTKLRTSRDFQPIKDCAPAQGRQSNRVADQPSAKVFSQAANWTPIATEKHST